MYTTYVIFFLSLLEVHSEGADFTDCMINLPLRQRIHKQRVNN